MGIGAWHSALSRQALAVADFQDLGALPYRAFGLLSMAMLYFADRNRQKSA